MRTIETDKDARAEALSLLMMRRCALHDDDYKLLDMMCDAETLSDFIMTGCADSANLRAAERDHKRDAIFQEEITRLNAHRK